MALSLEDVAHQMRERGIEPPAQLYADGKKITWAGNPAKPKKKNAWCVLYEWVSPKNQKVYITGVYGMGDASNTFKVEATELDWSPAERSAWQEQRKKIERDAEAQRTEMAATAVAKAKKNWGEALLEGASAYLERKKVGCFGLRFFFGKLVVPLRDMAENLHGLQYISEDGSKVFGTGTSKEGHFHLIGNVAEGSPVLFAEGYATAASVHMATGWPVVVCFDAGNLMPVVAAWRKVYEEHEFIICADDDKHLVTRLCERLLKFGVAVENSEFSRKAGGVRDMAWELPDGRKVQLKAAFKKDRNDVYFIEGSITCDGVSHLLRLENAGRSKAMQVAKKHGARVILPVFSSRFHSLTDFNDLHVEEGLEVVRAQLTAPPAQVEPAPTRQPSGGGGGNDRGGGLRFPYLDDKYNIKGVRENVYFALYEDPVLAGLVRLNLFSHRIDKMREAPWRGPAGAWLEIDDMFLANYLAQAHGLLVSNPLTIQQAVTMYATDHAYNPVKDQMEALVWDGTPRCRHWIAEIMDGEDKEYSSLAGTYFLESMVARVYEPGCQMDYMLVLQGAQGAKKSSVLRILGGEFFAGGSFRVGDKDSLQVLQGRLIFNFNEFDALSKAERTAVKQFVAERKDVFRPPYSKGFAEFPRSVCLTADTNEDDFLRDDTGDRRYWVIPCGQIDVDKMVLWRDQLLAEAVHLYKQGARRYPTKEEEELYFKPEQERWKFVDMWQDTLGSYVNSKRQLPAESLMDGATIGGGMVLPNNEREFFSTVELITVALKIDVGKVQGAGSEQKRVASAMRSLGFKKHRFGEGGRSRGYLRIQIEKKEAGAGFMPAQAGESGVGEIPAWD